MIFSFFSVSDLHVTIQMTYIITLVCIAFLSYSVYFSYGHEAIKDSLYVVFFSLGAVILCTGIFGAHNILVAMFAGIFSGELMGMCIYYIKN